MENESRTPDIPLYPVTPPTTAPRSTLPPPSRPRDPVGDAPVTSRPHHASGRVRRRPLTAVAVAALVATLGAGSGAIAARVVHDDSSTATPPAATATATASTSIDASNVVEPILAKVEPSVVTIQTVGTARGPFGRPVQTQAAGTGMVVSSTGRIVTNAHVVDGADTVTVTLADGTSHEAKVVGADADIDVAVLQIVDSVSNLPTVQFTSVPAEVGETVVAIGNALALGARPTVTLGIVSATGRSISTGQADMTDLVQTDAAINPGNSGGPLVDTNGDVVGMNTAVAGDAQNIGFAISAATVQAAILRLTA